MIRKTMRFAIVIGALCVACAVPTAASASEWTEWNGWEHAPLGESGFASESFEGFVQFTVAAPTHSSFGCQVTVLIEAEGASGGLVTAFNPTTSTCKGTGLFAGCVLKGHTQDIPWDIDISGSPTITSWLNNIIIRSYYQGCTFGILESTLEFSSLSAAFTLNGGGTIEAMQLSGTSTSGVVLSGTLTPEFGPSLGLK